MTTIEAFAPAKINLSLHVTGQRSDGYHTLESLVVFADVGDTLTATEAEGLTLAVDGPLAEGVPADGRNLVMKAAGLMTEGGASLRLSKLLPAAAGIGGGSSDAAAALRALSILWKSPIPAETVTLGADVPVCLDPKPVIMSGVGETLDPVKHWPELACVLVNPRVEVPTPAVFKALPEKTNPPMDAIPALMSFADTVRWLATQRNDLEAPARSLAPVIGDVLAALSGAALARMSGSGATCFGLFETQADAKKAADEIAAAHADWWVMPCTLGGSS